MKPDQVSVAFADYSKKESGHKKWIRRVGYGAITILGYLLFVGVTILYFCNAYLKPDLKPFKSTFGTCDCTAANESGIQNMEHIHQKRSIGKNNERISYPVFPPLQDCYADNETYYTDPRLRFAINMDALINPCDDFYRYACGNYRNPYIPYQPPVLITTSEEGNNRNLHKVLKALANIPMENLPNGIQFAMAYLDACKNPPATEKRLPIIDWITENVHRWPLAKYNWAPRDIRIGIWALIGRIQRDFNHQSLLSINIDADHSASDHNSKRVLFAIRGKSALSYKPSSENYFDDEFLHSEYFQSIETAAKAYIKKGKFFTSFRSMSADINKLIAFERKLAEAEVESSKNVTERIIDYQTLNTTFNAINWDEYMTELNGRLPRYILLSNENYLKRLNNIIGQTDTKTLYNYVIWQLVRLDSLPADPFTEKSIFELELESPKKDCFAKLVEEMPVAVNWLLWNTTENELNMTRLLEMIEDIKRSYLLRLDELTDINNITRAAAKEKINNTMTLIGYMQLQTNRTAFDEYYADLKVPDSVDDFSIKMAIKRWRWERLIKWLDTTIDRSFELWPKVLAQPNAGHDHLENNHIIYIGNLQRPHFYQSMPDAILYGDMGFTIAHEFGHALDPKGIQYSSVGDHENVSLSELDHARFVKSVNALIAKYDGAAFACSRTNPIPYRINGTLVIEEAVADHIGLKVAFRALQRNSNHLAIEDSRFSMFSKEQLFFLSFANRFCRDRSADWKDEEFNNEHPPNPFRVNIALQNMPEFAETFRCPGESPMNPIEKAAVW